MYHDLCEIPFPPPKKKKENRYQLVSRYLHKWAESLILDGGIPKNEQIHQNMVSSTKISRVKYPNPHLHSLMVSSMASINLALGTLIVASPPMVHWKYGCNYHSSMVNMKRIFNLTTSFGVPLFFLDSPFFMAVSCGFNVGNSVPRLKSFCSETALLQDALGQMAASRALDTCWCFTQTQAKTM